MPLLPSPFRGEADNAPSLLIAPGPWNSKLLVLSIAPQILTLNVSLDLNVLAPLDEDSVLWVLTNMVCCSVEWRMGNLCAVAIQLYKFFSFRQPWTTWASCKPAPSHVFDAFPPIVSLFWGLLTHNMSTPLCGAVIWNDGVLCYRY